MNSIVRVLLSSFIFFFLGVPGFVIMAVGQTSDLEMEVMELIKTGMAKHQGKYPEGFKDLHLALEKARINSDKELESEALKSLMEYHFNQYAYDSSLMYANWVIDLGSKNQKIVSRAWERKADSYWFQGQFDTTVFIYEKAFSISEAISDSASMGRIKRNLGDYYRQVGDYVEANRQFMLAIQILVASGHKLELGTVYNNYSIVFNHLGDIHKELEYLLMALSIRKAEGGDEYIGLYQKNIAVVYLQIGNLDKALAIVNEALERTKQGGNKRYHMYALETKARILMARGDLEGAIESLNRSLLLAKEIREKRYLARLNRLLGEIEQEKDNLVEAEKYLMISLAYYSEIKDPSYHAQTLISLAENRLLRGKKKEAIYLVNEVIEMSKGFQNKMEIRKALELLVSYYNEEGNYNLANQTLIQLDSLKNVIFSENIAKNLALNEIIYETKMREYENSILKKDMEIQQYNLKRQESLIHNSLVLFIIALLVLGVLVYAYFRLQRSKHKISEQNMLLSLKNREIEKINEQQMDLMQLVAHDLKAPLHKIKGLAHILRMEGGLNKEQKEIVDMMEDVTERSSKFVIHLLEAQEIEKKALNPRLINFAAIHIIEALQNDYKGLLESKGLKLELENQMENNLQLYSDPELIAHATQNVLTNAIKFSHYGSTIWVKAKQNKNNVFIEIIDEGPGFSDQDKELAFRKFQRLTAKPTGEENSSGLGLYMVRLLMETLGGEVAIKNPNGKGARIVLRIPIKPVTSIP